MPNNFFAFSVVAFATSSNEIPLIQQFVPQPSFTYAGSFRFPLYG